MNVRVCVECGEEYRPEIVVCADCGGRLEDRLDDGNRTVIPAAEPAETEEATGEEGFLHSILHADRVALLTDAADRLLAAGIEFRLRAIGPATELASRYHLLVAEADQERAYAVLGVRLPERSGVCPACDTRQPAGAVECPECGLAVGDDPGDEPALD